MKKYKGTVLVTGCAGFIGYFTCLRLLDYGYRVVGIDNLNNYYSVKLKKNRLRSISNFVNQKNSFFFKKIDLLNFLKLKKLFKKYNFDYIVHLAAQAGVQYSLINPKSYINSNIIGFFNILELSKKFKIKHLITASTSSVYGANTLVPFKETDITDHQIQLYAATKKSNELMAHSYSYLFKIPITVLRFFTVYGPWGRPDMSLYKFVKNIINNKKIFLNNFGKHSRSFTYIDDVIDVIAKLIKIIPKKNFTTSSSVAPFEIYNVGNDKKITLKKFLKIIEKNLRLKAKVDFRKLQPGDIIETKAEISKIRKIVKSFPRISLEDGVKKFIDWYKKYYYVNKKLNYKKKSK